MNQKEFDKYIQSSDWLNKSSLPVAITLTEVLEPSEGKEAIIFPPTYAPPPKQAKPPHPYQIDELGTDEGNTCLIDSVGSQANRMEAFFKMEPLSELVPQIEIELEVSVKEDTQDGGEQNDDAAPEKSKPSRKQRVKVNLLDVGHRVVDGAVRFSRLSERAEKAILALRDDRNAQELAKLAPTSLVFGFWDSRPDTTMFKFGRILSSTIRATNVVPVKRSAQFNPTFDPALIGLAEELPEGAEEGAGNEDNSSGKAGDDKDPLSKLGLRTCSKSFQ